MLENRAQVSGFIKNLTFRNEETGYFVARCESNGKEVMVVGSSPVINVGEHFDATGSWEKTKWGMQFKVSDMRLNRPAHLEGIVKYLSSGAIEGIGPAMAKRMVEAHGERIFDVIENEPHLLSEIKGIGKARAATIVETYNTVKEIRKIMVFLHKFGLSASKAKRVFDAFGEHAEAKVSENPYILCEIVWGIGFKQADEFARSMGISPESDFRLRAAIRHVLDQATGDGSCGLPLGLTMTRAAELVELPDFALDKSLQNELKAKTIIKDMVDGEECLFLPKVYNAEKAIAQKIYRLAHLKPRQRIELIDEQILFAELDMNINLEQSQRDAVAMALGHNACIITGGPGTGKTTITKTVLEILESQGLSIALAAPTGKAARRAAEVSGREASTIHRLLEMKGKSGFDRNEHNPLEADVIVLDESSMIDVHLFLSVLKAVPFTSRLIIVGDVNQIPSVGPGKVLADLIESQTLPTVMLTKVFRQAATSQIIVNAHAVNSGEPPLYGWDEKSDFRFYNPGFPAFPLKKEERTPENKAKHEAEKALGVKRVMRFVTELWKKDFDPIKDVQVLAPTRAGMLGTNELNVMLKEALNGGATERIERFNGFSFSRDDKVMQLRNNYEKLVFNGDIGYIEELDVAAKSVVVNFDGRLITYKANELDEITLAYAITVHKSQGSEFPVVVMVLDSSHWMMLKKNILYTGMTRAKKLMVLMGTPWAADVAVKNSQIDSRYSKLRDWLRAEQATYGEVTLEDEEAEHEETERRTSLLC